MDKIEEAGLWCWARLLLAADAWGATNTAFGWIYPEHRDIAVLAVEGLDPERKAEFDRLWQEARVGDEKRLCVQGADGQGITPECIDWAALSAIAGDHSCSSQDMLETVRASDWILQVADVAAQLKEDLARIPVTATAFARSSAQCWKHARRSFLTIAHATKRSPAWATSLTAAAGQLRWSHRADGSSLCWCRESDTIVSRLGWRHRALSPRTCADRAMTSRAHRALRCAIIGGAPPRPPGDAPKSVYGAYAH